MDDLASKISELLNNPDGMSQIMDMASKLGLGGGPQKDEEQNEPQKNNDEKNGDKGLFGDIDINLIMTLQKAFSAANKSDKNTELLKALKPHFTSDRRHKVDDALRILQLINLLPIIKETGLFGGEK